MITLILLNFMVIFYAHFSQFLYEVNFVNNIFVQTQGQNEIKTNLSTKVEILPLNKKFVPGSVAIVQILTDSELVNPKISFAGSTNKFFKIEKGKYKGMAFTTALTKPGKYKLKAYDASGKLNYTEFIDVAYKKFPIQNIRVSSSTESLQPTADEVKKIEDAKNLLSDLICWEMLPFRQPTKGPIVSQYGLRRFHNGKDTGDYHKGIDIKAPQGAPIVAMEAGQVVIAEKFRLHGGTVAIDHGSGLMSIYIHMSKINVKVNDIIAKGEKIGEVGATGFATGPHLHWGVYVYGKPVNPADWL